jgi:hypothetical protein
MFNKWFIVDGVQFRDKAKHFSCCKQNDTDDARSNRAHVLMWNATDTKTISMLHILINVCNTMSPVNDKALYM